MTVFEWTPTAVLTVFNGVWIMGNIVMFVYLIYVLRKQAKEEGRSEDEVELLFQDKARKILMPRAGIFIAVWVLVKVLLNVVG